MSLFRILGGEIEQGAQEGIHLSSE